MVVLLQMLKPTYSATVVRRCVRILAYGAHGKRATREPIRATEPPLYDLVFDFVHIGHILDIGHF